MKEWVVVELEEQNPVEGPVHQQDQVSTTDPDSTCATKGGTPARLGYYDDYLVDNHSCVIVGVRATAARMSQETVAAREQQLSLPRRAAAQLWRSQLWRSQPAQPHLCLYRDPQTLWCVLSKSTMHQLEHSGFLPSTGMSLPGNAPAN